MAKHALAALESALRERKLDRTLTTAMPLAGQRDAAADLAPTGLAALDASLRGGLPRGHVSEIVGPPSSGRITLLLQMLAAATARGELVAVVDTFDRLDVASVLAAGVETERLLWIRGDAIAEHGRLHERVVDRALKALNLVLQAGGFGCVAIDLADVPPVTLKRLPFTTWLRLQRIVEGRDTACVLVAPHSIARSAGGLTLSLNARVTWTGESSRSRHIDGAALTTRVVSPRRHVDASVSIRTLAPSYLAPTLAPSHLALSDAPSHPCTFALSHP